MRNDTRQLIPKSFLMVTGTIALGLPIWTLINMVLFFGKKNLFFSMYPVLRELAKSPREFEAIMTALHIVVFGLAFVSVAFFDEASKKRDERINSGQFIFWALWIALMIEGIFLILPTVASVMYGVWTPILLFVASIVAGIFVFHKGMEKICRVSWF